VAYSQSYLVTHASPSAGQDQWITEQFPEGFKGYCIDVGAHDGHLLSNTLALEEAGWIVMCVEANPAHAPFLRLRRKRFMCCAVDKESKEWEVFFVSGGDGSAYSSLRPRMGTKREIKVPVLTLDQVIQIAGFPELDVLTLDIEGTELDALKGFDIDRWRPKVIIAECWPDTDAAQKIAEFLEPHGYNDVKTMEEDHGFVRA